MPPVTMTDLTPMLTARDLDETVNFYTTVLGCEVMNRIEHWCCMRWGKAEIMFTDNTVQPEHPHMTGRLYFNPSDVKSLWEDLKPKVTVDWELQTMFYNMVEFAIRDCNGYVLAFGQDVSGVAPPLPKRSEE